MAFDASTEQVHMTETGADSKKAQTTWKTSALRCVCPRLRFLVLSLLVTWATLAVYYSNLPWAWLRLALAVAFAAFSVWALWLPRRPRMGRAFAGLFVVVLVWFASIQPS